MPHQKKLWRINLDSRFWQEPKKVISYMVRDMLLGLDISRVARKIREDGVSCSDVLLYKWSNPGEPQIPNSEQLLLLMKHTENCEPIRAFGEPCGYIMVPDDDLEEALAILLAEYHRRKK